MTKKKTSSKINNTAGFATPAVASVPTKNTTKQLNKETEEKLENLRTLNRMLVKEAMEHREQLAQIRGRADSMAADNKTLSVLERDVSRILISAANSVAVEKKRSMRSQVSSVSAQLIDFEKVCEEKEKLEKRLQSVVDEKDDVVRAVGIKNRRIEELESKVQEMVVENRGAMETLEKVRNECLRLVESEKEREGFMRLIISEKKSLDNRVLEYDETVKRMGKETEKSVRMNEAEVSSLKAERDNQAETIVGLEDEIGKMKSANDQLEKDLSGAREMIELLKGKEEGLQSEITELGKKNARFEVEVRRLRAECGIMEEEMKDKEMMFECKFRESRKRIDELTGMVKEIAGKKDALKQEKTRQEAQVRELENMVGELLSAVHNLEESIKEKDESNATLQSYVDSFWRELNVEREEGSKLGTQLEKAVKTKDTLEQELGDLRAKLDRMDSGYEKAKMQCEVLEKEKVSSEESLLAVQNDLAGMRGKVELAGFNSARSLSLLKNTMEAINASLEGQENSAAQETVNEISEEVCPFMLELDGIKMAFTSKAKKTEELIREVELLRIALAEEQKNKKKQLWIWLCPATAIIFAAIAFAYATRAH